MQSDRVDDHSTVHYFRTDEIDFNRFYRLDNLWQSIFQKEMIENRFDFDETESNLDEDYYFSIELVLINVSTRQGSSFLMLLFVSFCSMSIAANAIKDLFGRPNASPVNRSEDIERIQIKVNLTGFDQAFSFFISSLFSRTM